MLALNKDSYFKKDIVLTFILNCGGQNMGEDISICLNSHSKQADALGCWAIEKNILYLLKTEL